MRALWCCARAGLETRSLLQAHMTLDGEETCSWCADGAGACGQTSCTVLMPSGTCTLPDSCEAWTSSGCDTCHSHRGADGAECVWCANDDSESTTQGKCVGGATSSAKDCVWQAKQGTCAEFTSGNAAGYFGGDQLALKGAAGGLLVLLAVVFGLRARSSLRKASGTTYQELSGTNVGHRGRSAPRAGAARV